MLAPVSRIDSVALSALDDTIMRATERVRVLVGRKPTCTEQVAFGASEPTQVLLTIEKSPGRSPSRMAFWLFWFVLLARPMPVMVAAASPVFLIVTAFELWTPAAVAANSVGRPRMVGTTAVPTPLRFVRLISASVRVPPSCSWL